ncbi:MAG: low-specificity L-threonine aldolase [Armatimonadota bacterium]|nr:low-specificity L-threonine aldolase [Armatimonadota bacterium]
MRPSRPRASTAPIRRGPEPARAIDLRSDTVTLPTEAMREAMARAEVGDDVYGEDPSVSRLEAMAAQRLAKDAALFVPSGTMANLVAVMAHTQRGDEVVLDDQAHTLIHEAGSIATLAGVMPRALPTQWGYISGAQLEAALRPPDLHFPPTRLVCVENTHNRHGGIAVPPEAIDDLAEVAHRHGLRVHMDGARIFNAAVALGVPAARLAAAADSVTFCLSKGLSAPVGSVLCGPRPFIAQARRFRKMVGGGMRQAGVLAAAGIVALEEMVERLADDHRLARRLAEALVGIPGLEIDLARVQTNMVRIRVSGRDARAVATALGEHGVRVGVVDASHLRLVTHRHVTPSDLPAVVDAFRAAMRASS